MPVKLPFDVEEEILSRVPCRPLTRLRCVCKLWNSLIPDDKFIRKNFYHRHSNGIEHQFIFKQFEMLSSVAIDQEQQNALSLTTQDLTLKRVGTVRTIQVYKVVHCDGLLLCVMDNQLLVWNPLLKETTWVKCGSDFHQFDDAYSLGYVNHCGYRILRFRCAGNSRDRPPRVEVYSFSSKTWKVIDMISFDWVFRVPLLLLSLGGTTYCIGLRRGRKFGFLQSFSFPKERFQTIDDLPFKYNLVNPLALEIYKGDGLSVLEQCHKTRKICIWVKHFHVPSWSRVKVVAIPDFPLLYPLFSNFPANYYVDKDNRLVINSVDDIGGISINRVIGKKEFQTIVPNFEEPNTITSYSCCYVPSLVRLPGFSKQDSVQVYLLHIWYLSTTSFW